MEWRKKGKFLVKEFKFSNFIEAIDFVKKLVPLAEKVNHHPDILIHSYNKVKIMMYTHSENKITEKDHSLAMKIDEI
ncbi:MAG: 4a-hydroxytetrahydrobiopterin dehydratase [Candidatus Woesearchaeota archaeon]